ncbi:MaoC family dehydratase [Marmoricola endophyticus]|uniref:MaoC family dehydratase n=1 Tax=Marmoricola endophyticus TaxID=2040280 RepID=A0A917BGZ9_9ACTN|nr:MaoC/PaaZ C-terminal domain-containing protein [Marmoricola endophyticus]GGF43459.1 MaoC family dehydratase [Marmoricola endophyticus]
MSTLEPGTDLPPQEYVVTRADLVAYAAASGDDNPIHQDEEIARAVGLPGVIAHGMYTLALAARAVQEWAGGPGRVEQVGAKFTKPVVVPAGDEGTTVRVAGTVKSVADGRATLALTVTCGEDKVLGMPTAVLRV